LKDLLNIEDGNLPVQRRTAPKTMARWLFCFVSRCSSTVFWIVLFLQARNGCFFVFLSFSVFLFPLWDCVCEEKKNLLVSAFEFPCCGRRLNGKGPGTGGWLDPSFLGFLALFLLWFCLWLCFSFTLFFWFFRVSCVPFVF